MREKILLLGLSSLVSLLCLEGFLYAFMPRFIGFYQFRPQAESVELSGAKDLFDSETFDGDLGWDKAKPIRNVNQGEAHGTFLAQAYGDSFVFCSEVEDEGSWQAAFEEIAGQSIANLGVGGYGLDQAVLKFEKYAHTVESEVAILGIFREMHRRNLSHHYVYYSHDRRQELLFKPIFVEVDGRYTLMPIPCTSADCMMALLNEDPKGLEGFLQAHDHFYRFNQSLPKNRFPRTLRALSMLPRIQRSKNVGPDQSTDFFPEPHALDLSLDLVHRFMAGADNRGMRPLILLIYSVRDLKVMRRGLRPDQAFVDALESEGIPFVDTSVYILDRWDGDVMALKAPGSHFNPQGNRLIAEALVAHFESLPSLVPREVKHYD